MGQFVDEYKQSNLIVKASREANPVCSNRMSTALSPCKVFLVLLSSPIRRWQIEWFMMCCRFILFQSCSRSCSVLSGEIWVGGSFWIFHHSFYCDVADVSAGKSIICYVIEMCWLKSFLLKSVLCCHLLPVSSLGRIKMRPLGKRDARQAGAFPPYGHCRINALDDDFFW